jgi:hypothetical protein
MRLGVNSEKLGHHECVTYDSRQPARAGTENPEAEEYTELGTTPKQRLTEKT